MSGISGGHSSSGHFNGSTGGSGGGSSTNGSARNSTGGRGSSTSATSKGVALVPKCLLRRHRLPVAAHLHAPTAPPGLNLERPLLLYSNYSSTKVRAMSLASGMDGTLFPVGPALVIPDSYTGWFSIVSPEGVTAKVYTSVEEVAQAKLPFFLTRYDVTGYTKVTDEKGHTSYQKQTVQSGNVLKLLGVFEDVSARRTSSSGSLLSRGSGNSRSQDVGSNRKYAQCLNYKDEVLFVPFGVSGRFYAPAHRTSRSTDHVFLMSQLLKNYKLPLTVRLICGFMPRVPFSFTGMLRLETAHKEQVILACTMTSEARATLLEMDVASNFVLSPIMDPLFSKSPIFLKTVSYCQDEGETWRRQIKVTHHVTDDESPTSTKEKPAPRLPIPINLPGFGDFERKRGRLREKNRENKREKSRVRDKSKDNQNKLKENRSRDKSWEPRVRDLIRDKSRDFLREKSRSRDGSGDIIILRPYEKSKGKGSETRKLSKQNTYIFQNGNKTKSTEKTPPKSVANLDYSTVADDISPIREEHDAQYAEIGEYASTSELRHNNDYDEVARDDYKSFTLLKKDVGRYYVELSGFDIPDSSKIGKCVNRDVSVC